MNPKVTKRYNIRLAGILLITLFLTIITVTVLTIFSIKGHQAELKEAALNTTEKELTLLANRIEQNLLRTIESSLRLLRSLEFSRIDPDTISTFLGSYTNINQVFFLDENMNLMYSYPKPANEYESHLNDWIIERIQQITNSANRDKDTPIIFVEDVDNDYYLYALNPTIDLSGINADQLKLIKKSGSRILVRFNLSSLKKSVLPLMKEFSNNHPGTIELTNKDPGHYNNSITEPLDKVLPGWYLIYKPYNNTSNFDFSRQNILLISLVTVALFAIILASLAIWIEIRREYADVELRNRFISNVSHELKTPLSLIRMYAETLLLRRITGSEKQQEYHGVILREAERLSGLIENVLDFSQLRSGKNIYHLTESDLRRTVQEILDKYKSQFEKTGMEIEVFFQNNLPPVLHDPNGITQIVLNLLDNIEKYAGPNKKVDIRLLKDNDRINLQVTDFGRGLSEKQYTDLIKFIQNERVTNIIQGSGIGLSMVDLIAKAHNANFIIDAPEQHTGLKIIISFPIYRA